MEYDYETDELLQEAIDRGYIEEDSTAHGVAKKYVADGYNSLSDSQKAVIDRHVLPHLAKITAEREIQDRMRGCPTDGDQHESLHV